MTVEITPMDVDHPSPQSSPTKVVPPLFDFPSESSRSITANDLLGILRWHNSRFPQSKKRKSPTPAPKVAKKKSATLELLTGDSSRKRIIFRHWPRAPKGDNITPNNSLPGKMTPNGIQLWGSTMFDFYRVMRMVDVPQLSTITTGSKLMRWMKEHGELTHAKDEIEFAEMEEDPKIIVPWSPRVAMEEMEVNIKLAKAGKSMPPVTATNQIWQGSKIEYTSPWPIVPFSYKVEPLATTIHLDHLPKRLIVHDPWNLLAVDSRNTIGRAHSVKRGEEDWTSKKDVPHVYKLQMSPAAVKKAKREAEKRAKVKENEDRCKSLLDTVPMELGGGAVDGEAPLEGYLIRPPPIAGPIAPPIFVVHGPPPRPHAPKFEAGQPIEEAHLYISPSHEIGIGNHSVVYHVELELPRSSILPPPSTDYVLCESCVDLDIKRILKEEDGENGERRDRKWDKKLGEVKLIPEGRPSVRFRFVERANLENGDSTPEDYVFDTEDTTYRAEYLGPVRPIRTMVEWQDPMHPTCSHVKPPPEVPPTVRVGVVGKLSNKHDEHLAREAVNYESFEDHFYQHWSGLNVLPPMHDPVPVGTLVPQFYGYYVPDLQETEETYEEVEEEEGEDTKEKEEGTKEKETKKNGDVDDAKEGEDGKSAGESRNESPKTDEDVTMGEPGNQVEDTTPKPKRKVLKTKKVTHSGYFSPILLLEECGTPVDPDKLTEDQKNEALSLIYRFHHAGWLHNSIYARNIVAQPGPLNVPPSERSKKNMSFRLIDFGRSTAVKDDDYDARQFQSSRCYEETSVQKLFKMGLYSHM